MLYEVITVNDKLGMGTEDQEQADHDHTRCQMGGIRLEHHLEKGKFADEKEIQNGEQCP